MLSLLLIATVRILVRLCCKILYNAEFDRIRFTSCDNSNNMVHALLVAVSTGGTTGTQSADGDQPVVSLLCVDEAHCLSQWSYNFRPAFLRIRREVQFIQPAAVLALTATATPRIQVT